MASIVPATPLALLAQDDQPGPSSHAHLAPTATTNQLTGTAPSPPADCPMGMDDDGLAHACKLPAHTHLPTPPPPPPPPQGPTAPVEPYLLPIPLAYTLPVELPSIYWTDKQLKCQYGMSSNETLLHHWGNEIPIYREEKNFTLWCTEPIYMRRPKQYAVVQPETMKNIMVDVKLFLGFAYKFARVPIHKLSLVAYTDARVFMLVSEDGCMMIAPLHILPLTMHLTTC